MLINTGNISRKVLSKVLRSFDKNFERLQSIAQSDTGTHGKKASREQAESKGKKNDSKSPDQKNTTGADSTAKADKKPSHSENQESSDSKADTTKQEDQPENPDRDQSNDGNGKDSGKKSSDTIELPFVPAE